FNLTVYRSRVQPDGNRTREQEELYLGLSMDPRSGDFVETRLNGVSALVTASASAAPTAGGISVSGLVLPATEANVETGLATLVTPTANRLRVSVAHNPPVTVTLPQMADITNPAQVANIETAWALAINSTLTSNSMAATVAVDITGSTVATGGVADGRLLAIASSNGPVVITPATENDASVALMLGVGAGGIEGDTFGDVRPAPTGLVSRNGTSADVFAAFRRFASAQRDDLTGFTLTDDSPEATHGAGVVIALGGPERMYRDAGAGTSNLVNARTAFDVLAATLAANTSGRWTARRDGWRLALRRVDVAENGGLGATLTTQGGYNIGGNNQPFAAAANPSNVAAYTIGQPSGVAGAGPFQSGSVEGLDGIAPGAADYAALYPTLERETDFNILVLPRAEGQSDDARRAVWGPASAFCASQRAFLLVDPRVDWTDVTAAEAGVDVLRIGTETRNAAVYWPRLRVPNGGPAGRAIDPSGSIAGLMARTDANRGVWKAPAGIEATIRGVTGVERPMTDPENGVINPKALNAIRVFPAGVVSWGARTMVGFDGSGNIDDKYIPVRRTMLFIEESLYRGLAFAVFEPNDEPLWAQIRLAAGSFMNGLFRQGAFAGAKATDAYFVLCDHTTTTPNDINLGIVNVIVGFAPLKPAEFVVLTVKQIAGQVQV
ncbi:MAG TPA: phage tail sheath subtilisin-like domain-containing protein, partial [Egibacteraceae bacterium]|nr:phage tail sheath subtilisin-like domain-containing protein [Egibacteraceae bacterium]